MLIVKICGLSTVDALDAALDAGADFVGFVFFPPSPRNVSFEAAKSLGARSNTRKVALTVDAEDITFDSIVKSLQPNLLQLHGRETPEHISVLKQRYGLPIIKAIAVEDIGDFALIKEYASVCEWILFDAKAPADATRPGGLGKPFDWALLSGAIPGVPVILSGGLNIENVSEALRITRVPAVDVSSGVESSPGNKDPKKIREFIRRAREAHLRLPPRYEVLSEP